MYRITSKRFWSQDHTSLPCSRVIWGISTSTLSNPPVLRTLPTICSYSTLVQGEERITIRLDTLCSPSSPVPTGLLPRRMSTSHPERGRAHSVVARVESYPEVPLLQVMADHGDDAVDVVGVDNIPRVEVRGIELGLLSSSRVQVSGRWSLPQVLAQVLDTGKLLGLGEGLL